MAKDRKADAGIATAAWEQNTALQFTANGAVFRVVDFENEMTALQDEDLIALVGDVLPAVFGLDERDGATMLAALSMLIDNVTSKALLRRVLAMLFLPDGDRVYKREAVDERIELLANLPNKQYLPLLESIKDFFAFAGKNFPNVSATFMGLKNKEIQAG
jgi:hypothetical protein